MNLLANKDVKINNIITWWNYEIMYFLEHLSFLRNYGFLWARNSSSTYFGHAEHAGFCALACAAKLIK